MISKRRMFLGFIVVAAMMLMGVSNVLAAPFVPQVAADEDEATEIEIKGTVVGLTGTTLTVEVEEDGGTQTYTVLVPDDFDMSAVVVDETVVEVEGTVGEDGTVSASKVEIGDDEDSDVGDDEGTGDVGDDEGTGDVGDDEDTGDVGDDEDTGDVNDGEVISDTVGISDTVRIHPVGAAIAESYGVSYDTVMQWRAEYKAGFGQIMLALQTGLAMGGVISPTVTAGDTVTPTIDSDTEETDLADLATGYLQQRKGGQGWGNIWNGLGLVGHGKKAGVPEDEDTEDVTDDSGTDTEGDADTLQMQTQTQIQTGKGGKKNVAPGQQKDRTGTGKPDKTTGNGAKNKSTGKPTSSGKSKGGGKH